MVDIERPESHGGKIAILRMSRAPVNSLNYPFMKDLTSAIEILEKVKFISTNDQTFPPLASLPGEKMPCRSLPSLKKNFAGQECAGIHPRFRMQ